MKNEFQIRIYILLLNILFVQFFHKTITNFKTEITTQKFISIPSQYYVEINE